MARKKTAKSKNGSNLAEYSPEIPLDPAIQIITVDENGLRDMLAKLRGGERFIADLAAKLDISPQMLGDVLRGEKGFGPKLLRALGVVRTRTIYDVEIIMEGPPDEPSS